MMGLKSIRDKRTFGGFGIGLLAALMLSPLPLWALGLGEIQVQSAMNEPFSARIAVLNPGDVEEGELLVALGGVNDYQAAGVRWEFSHSDLRFEVEFTNPSAPVVLVFSSRPIREPYLNFLVQTRWPTGRLLREYTVLLDFPVFGGNSPQPNTSAPATASVPAPAPTPAPAPQVTRAAAPAASAPAAAAARPAPAAVAPAPSSTPATDSALGADEIRIEIGDTLWSLGGRVAAQMGVSRQQAMLALRDTSPGAFVEGNLNLLKAGSVIRLPSRAEATRRSAEQASAEYVAAMQQGGVSATPLQSRVADFREDGAANDSAAQFRLASNTAGDATVAGSGQLAAADDEIQRLQDEKAVLSDQLQAAEVQNQYLRERLANLEEQVELMDRLVTVQSESAAEVQQAIAASEELAAAAEVVAAPVASADVREQGLLGSIIGWLPLVGLVLVGLLVGAYLVMRRKKDSDAADSASLDYDEYEEDEEADDAESAEEISLDLGETEDDAESDNADDNADDDQSDESFDDLEATLNSDLDDLAAMLDEDDIESDEPAAEVALETDESALVSVSESDADDDLLADFEDDGDDLESSDLDLDVECETKLELAEAYLEMGDKSGAKELLDEVSRDGQGKFAERLAALQQRIDS